MQTFLPRQDFIDSAKCLDYRRLGKQRVECKQILAAITGESKAWDKHPCVNMWRDYVPALKAYYNAIVREWISRGYVNNMPLFDDQPYDYPHWLTDEFCAIHRAALLFKNYEHYSQHGWTEMPAVNYIWTKKKGD